MTKPIFRPESERSKQANRTVRWVVLNQLGAPGLGTILMGQKLIGALQLAMFLPGFALFAVWFGRLMHFYYSLLDFQNSAEPPAGQAELLVAGLTLCAFAWIWSLVSGLRAMRRDRERASRTGPPPMP